MTQKELNKLTGRAKDKATILNPELWPCKPLLPVKGNGKLGLLVRGLDNVVFETSLYAPVFDCKQHKYETVDLLLENWTVD